MALTPAEKQKRYRERRKAEDQASPDTIERALIAEVQRCERGELSDQERIALADKLADLAKDFLWRAHRLSRVAMKYRPGPCHQPQARTHDGRRRDSGERAGQGLGFHGAPARQRQELIRRKNGYGNRCKFTAVR